MISASISVTNLTPTQISLGLASAVTLIGYAVFIFIPAWTSYGRMWERVAAGFLSLFILAALVGIGIGIGAGVVYAYVKAA